MPLTAEQVLQNEFLQARARILELAAILDRIDRSTGNVGEHPQFKQLQQGISLLTAEEPDKAAAVQLLFSRQYDPNWRQAMSV
jgi:hypothetical protein